MGHEEERNRTAGADEQVFTANDMLLAFKHGREFEQAPGPQDGSEKDFGNYDEKHWPFWEWLKAHDWSV